MGVAIFIARVFGLCYLILGTGFLFNRRAFAKVMEDFGKNAALTFLSGLFALVIGVVIILLHNVWVANWTVIITIIGWAGLFKGIWLIVFPETVPKFMQAYLNNKNLQITHASVALILGIVLTYLGFF